MLILLVYREKFVGRFVDLEKAIDIDATDASGASLWDDSLHFSPAGYRKMADEIYDVIVGKVLELAGVASARPSGDTSGV